MMFFFFFFQAEDGIRDIGVTGVQTCALPILMGLIENNIRPRDVMTFEAFENAIMMANAIGGSTNAVLHLLAIAREVGVQLKLSDFERIRKRTPHIADMRPGGTYIMRSEERRVGKE